MKKPVILTLLLLIAIPVFANGLPDSDHDGVPDADEISIYKTDYLKSDTDDDGYSDHDELVNGYSPLNPLPVKLEDSDYDNDGLSDRMELNFHTDLTNPDTDGDDFMDGEEIDGGFDPLIGDHAILKKRLEINLDKQELSYYLGGVRMGIFPVSSGQKGTWTPTGHFRIDGKALRAWSRYGLWMPYWMSLQHGYFGIHELPEWPDGTKEGEDHLGTPVSHGCIRLGVGPAELLYNWAPVGTEVYLY